MSDFFLRHVHIREKMFQIREKNVIEDKGLYQDEKIAATRRDEDTGSIRPQ